MDSIRIGILTVSDGVANGTRVDRSGDAIAAWAATAGSTVVRRDTVSDDGEAITRALLAFVDADRVDVVLTTGGTGFTMRDVTPEATRAVIDRLAPGIAEAI
ncbi:MAG: molybdopterin-binding protein, partial [Longimicrobiales bacterium]